MLPHDHSHGSGSVRVPRPGLHPHQLSICALLQFLFSEETRDSFWRERGDDLFGWVGRKNEEIFTNENYGRLVLFLVREIHGSRAVTAGTRSPEGSVNMDFVRFLQAISTFFRGSGNDNAEETSTSICAYLTWTYELIDSPDCLVDRFSACREILTMMKKDEDGEGHRLSYLSMESVGTFTLFLRRFVLQTKKLTFAGLSRFYDDVMEYKAKETSNDFSVGATTLQGLPSSEMEFTAHASVVDELDAPYPNFSPYKHSYGLPKVQYLSYLQHLKRKDYQAAMDCVHQYFDCCVTNFNQDQYLSSFHDRGNGSGSGSGRNAANRGIRELTQYATLNLAILHLHFGHFYESLTAVNETIRMAQQKGDNVCVTHALFVLYQLMESTGDRQMHYLLQRCHQRSGISSHHQTIPKIATFTSLAKATFSITNIVSSSSKNNPPNIAGTRPRHPFLHWRFSTKICPRAVWDVLSYAQVVSNAHEQQQTGGNGQHTPLGSAMKFGESAGNQSGCRGQVLQAQTELLRAHAWQSFGHSDLSVQAILSYLACHSSEIPGIGDNVNTGTTQQQMDPHNTVIAMCQLAQYILQSSSPIGGASLYEEAQQVLGRAMCLVPLSGNIHCCRSVCSTLYSKSLSECHLLTASTLVSRLADLSMNESDKEGSSAMTIDYIESSMRLCHLMKERGCSRTLSSACDTLVEICQRRNLSLQEILITLLRSQNWSMHAKGAGSNCPHPQSLFLALRSLSLCSMYQLDTVYGEVAVELADLCLRYGLPEIACDILNCIASHSSGHNSLNIQARAHITGVKCKLTILSETLRHFIMNSSPASKLEDVTTMLPAMCKVLEKTVDMYMSLHMLEEARESAYLLAHMYHKLGELSLRHKALKIFKDIQKKLRLAMQPRPAMALKVCHDTCFRPLCTVK